MPQISKGARLWLWKRKGRKSIWLIRDGGFQRSTGFGPDELGKAEEALADYITSRRPDTSRRHTHEIGVAEVLNLYQMDLPENKPSRELVGYHVANLLQYWGGKSLAQVKGSTCRQYLEFRSHSKGGASSTVMTARSSMKSVRPVSPATVRRELKSLSAAINHWHKESPLVAVPKVTLPEEGERRERVLERAEVARMLLACRKRKWSYVARFILLGIYTGTRHAALLRLRWEESLAFGHVDTERGIIFRRGSSERETSKRRPPVQIPNALLRRIRRWKEMDAKALSAPRFVISYHGQTVKKIKRAWRTIRSDAALGPEVTPHVLRHTCATWNLWAGKTTWDVAGIIGADASTVERVYGHHKLEAVTQPVAKRVG